MQLTLLPITLLLALAASAPHPRNTNNQPTPNTSCQQQAATKPKAIYFLTNDAQNAVVALPVNSKGMLSKGNSQKTGGAGSNSVDAATGLVNAPDGLASQSALTVAGRFLFAVNAGSNTVSMMAISKDDPTSLTMVGKPVALPGEFPNTVAASMKNQLVCVGMSGKLNGVSCANFGASGIGEMDGLRPFGLNQSTPPQGPLNTVSQTFFSEDETKLFTTVKGDPAVNNTGFLSAFDVQKESRGQAYVAMKDTRSSPKGTAVLFGSAVVPDDTSSIFVTDASFGAGILTVDKNGVATTKAKQTIAGQKATCWGTISKATKSAYVTDVLVNRVVEMSLDDASIIKELDLVNGDMGLIDLKAAGNFVYALAPGNGSTEAAITVLDVSGGQGSMNQVQHFALHRIAGKNAQGMAIFI